MHKSIVQILGLDTFISTFSKNFLFSSLQIVSSSQHNSENEVKQKQDSELEQNIEVEMVYDLRFINYCCENVLKQKRKIKLQ
jgi:hypothetical protein